MTGNGAPPNADKNLGEIVSEVSEKASLLVRQEIDLAKAEITQKVGKLTWQPAAAWTGASGAMAFSTASASACWVRWRTETAAGRRGFNTEPSGTTSLTGRLQPSFWAISGATMHLTA